MQPVVKVKRLVINRSLIRNNSKLNRIFFKQNKRVGNHSLNSSVIKDSVCLQKHKKIEKIKAVYKTHIKNDLRGYLSLNSKNFFASNKGSKDKAVSVNSIKNGLRKLKLKNKGTRNLFTAKDTSKDFYISPKYEKRRGIKNAMINNTVIMNSTNYSRLINPLRQSHKSSFSKQSDRRRGHRSGDYIQKSLCLGGEFASRIDLQDSLRKINLNGSFFEKMKKFGKKKLKHGSSINRRKNMSIYALQKNNQFRKEKGNRKVFEHLKGFACKKKNNKEMALGLGLNLTMVKTNTASNKEAKSLTNHKNIQIVKRCLRLKQRRGTGSLGQATNIYKHLDDFEKRKVRNNEENMKREQGKYNPCKQVFAKRNIIVNEIAEISQSLNCTGNFNKFTLKIQNKENHKEVLKGDKYVLDKYYYMKKVVGNRKKRNSSKFTNS